MNKKYLIIIPIVLLSYLVYGSFDSKQEINMLAPIISRVLDSDNVVVSLNKIDYKDLTEQEIKLINNYFENKTVQNLEKIKPIVSKFLSQINSYEESIKKPYWFNNNIPENNQITEDLTLPPFGLTRSLTRLYIVQLENDLVAGTITKSVYQDKLQQIYDFGNKIENGSYAHIEFLFGKSIKAMAHDQAGLNKVNLKESFVSKEIKERVLLSEFSMSENFLKLSKIEMRSRLEAEFSFVELIPVYIPFTFHKNRTLNYFASEIPNALSYIENGNCKSYVPIREFHWYDWLTRNSFGKMMLSKALVLPQSLCE